MPKRRNPFGEITPLQRKTHVGFQQMATQEDRHEVYGKVVSVCTAATSYFCLCVCVCVCSEKTRALLFQGANPSSRAAPHRGPRNGHLTFPSGCPRQALLCNGQTASTKQQLCGHNGTPNGEEGGVCVTPQDMCGAGSSGGVGVSSEGVGGCDVRDSQPGLLSYFQSSHGSMGGSRPREMMGVQERRREGVRKVCSVCQRWCEVCKCEHCDSAVCRDCCRPCHHCQLIFCSSCSVLK